MKLKWSWWYLAFIAATALIIILYVVTGFTSCRGKLCSGLSVPEPDIPATETDQIVTHVKEYIATKGNQLVFGVNVYNEEFNGLVAGTFSCPGEGAEAFTVCSAPQIIPQGEDKKFKFIIPKGILNQKSTRTCKLSFFETDIEQIADCEILEPSQGAAVRSLEIPVTIN